MSEIRYKVGELAKLTGVKEGTIRFYEKSGFLEKVERLPNRYRFYTEHHLYQVKICQLVRTVVQYNAAGFHAAVLNYSVEPHCFPEPQRNLATAIRIIREHAAE